MILGIFIEYKKKLDDGSVWAVISKVATDSQVQAPMPPLMGRSFACTLHSDVLLGAHLLAWDQDVQGWREWPSGSVHSKAHLAVPLRVCLLSWYRGWCWCCSISKDFAVMAQIFKLEQRRRDIFVYFKWVSVALYLHPFPLNDRLGLLLRTGDAVCFPHLLYGALWFGLHESYASVT